MKIDYSEYTDLTKVNAQHLVNLIEFVRVDEEHFNMRYFFHSPAFDSRLPLNEIFEEHPCGSAFCIGGACAILMKRTFYACGVSVNIADYLGVDKFFARFMGYGFDYFWGKDFKGELEKIPHSLAMERLEDLLSQVRKAQEVVEA